MSAAKKTGNIFVWGILGLLMIGLTGFGVTNFGGSVRSVGNVGDTPISTDRYYRALMQEIRAAEAQLDRRLTLAEAQEFGLVFNARARSISDTALDNELARVGLSVGDAEVARALKEYAAFQGTDGKFDRETYRFTLQQNGLTEAEFEEQLRADTSRALLQGAVMSGRALPASYGKVITTYLGERRGYSAVMLDEAALDAPVGTPDETALTAYYNANADTFTAPVTKEITYALLTPDMLLDKVAIDEASLRALYDERIDEYVQPERRIVERLVYPDAAAAQAARARLDAGTASFEDLVAERGLELSDIDMGDVAKADLGAAGEAVFALAGPGIAGPLETDLGPALIRMNAVLEAQETSFEDAQPDLRDELAQDAARRDITDRITQVDDLLAAGATLEELDRDTDMELGTVSYFPAQDATITGYDAFRAAADAAQPGDFPEVIELDDGGIMALRVDAITDAHLRPLDEVRDQAIAGWQAEETRRQLSARAEALKTQLDQGTPIADLGLPVQTLAPATRGAIAPRALTEPLFALPQPGASAVVAAEDGAVYVISLDAIEPADTQDDAIRYTLSALEAQSAQAVAQDLMIYFTQSRLNEAGLTLDQAAINAVHAQLP
ncbi:peptidyl-prolyl cis-trans isomerase [Actibacterium sp. XHP0104]|uniref:peptidyl-prolyl cis-trans isomerase n=1 Tax=Actibacterium sp. XHP0104 TaxID=2984335 RepID=UPI0021E81EAF|nr:peptidyl-prolyl cis-trans isomerase [Actibacterium sp. XHP0104]MCV2880877.1 peptidyl-prolyl cis-trans isomerase [Actibacterium sp. XHP0104]